jgi:hypothetical protein
MSKLLPKKEHAQMMFDEYNVSQAYYPIASPMDVILYTNINILDHSNNVIDSVVESTADAALYRFQLTYALFANIHLTIAALENILISTDTRIPERVKVRNLPPALK